jgi:hypothetical protein
MIAARAVPGTAGSTWGLVQLQDQVDVIAARAVPGTAGSTWGLVQLQDQVDMIAARAALVFKLAQPACLVNLISN